MHTTAALVSLLLVGCTVGEDPESPLLVPDFTTKWVEGDDTLGGIDPPGTQLRVGRDCWTVIPMLAYVRLSGEGYPSTERAEAAALASPPAGLVPIARGVFHEKDGDMFWLHECVEVRVRFGPPE